MSAPYQLDEKGRCCGRKPVHYKGGAWNSPPQSPMHLCVYCHREFGPDGIHRESFAWKRCANCGCWVNGYFPGPVPAYCSECSVEQDCPP